jgi:hypothetical protein
MPVQPSRGVSRYISAIAGAITLPWRERMGIEPIGDAPRRPLGFEGRGRHQYSIRSHGWPDTGCVSAPVRFPENDLLGHTCNLPGLSIGILDTRIKLERRDGPHSLRVGGFHCT